MTARPSWFRSSCRRWPRETASEKRHRSYGNGRADSVPHKGASANILPRKKVDEFI